MRFLPEMKIEIASSTIKYLHLLLFNSHSKPHPTSLPWNQISENGFQWRRRKFLWSSIVRAVRSLYQILSVQQRLLIRKRRDWGSVERGRRKKCGVLFCSWVMNWSIVAQKASRVKLIRSFQWNIDLILPRNVKLNKEIFVCNADNDCLINLPRFQMRLLQWHKRFSRDFVIV